MRKQRLRTTSKRANKLLTRKQYAAHRGITRQRVDRLIAQGRIPLTEDGLIDLVVADAQLEATVPEAAKATNGKASPALEKLRLVQAGRAQSAKRILDLEYKKRSGVLVDRERAEDHERQVVGIIFQHLGRCGSSYAPRFAAESNPWLCQRLFAQAVSEAAAAAGYEHRIPPIVPRGAMHDAASCRVFDENGEVIVIRRSQEHHGWCWITCRNAGWEFVETFYDRDGRPIDPPQMVDGIVVGAPDVTGGEYDFLGKRFRCTTPSGDQWEELPKGESQ